MWTFQGALGLPSARCGAGDRHTVLLPGHGLRAPGRALPTVSARLRSPVGSLRTRWALSLGGAGLPVGFWVKQRLGVHFNGSVGSEAQEASPPRRDGEGLVLASSPGSAVPRLRGLGHVA